MHSLIFPIHPVVVVVVVVVAVAVTTIIPLPTPAEQAHRVVGFFVHDREAWRQQQRDACIVRRTSDPESSTGFHEFRFVLLFRGQGRKRRERKVNNNHVLVVLQTMYWLFFKYEYFIVLLVGLSSYFFLMRGV